MYGFTPFHPFPFDFISKSVWMGDRAMEDEQRNCISRWVGNGLTISSSSFKLTGYTWSACRNLGNQGELWTVFANSDIPHPQVLLRTLKKPQTTGSSPQASLLLQSTTRHLLCLLLLPLPLTLSRWFFKRKPWNEYCRSIFFQTLCEMISLGQRWGIAPNCPEPGITVGTSHWFLLQLTPPRETP